MARQAAYRSSVRRAPTPPPVGGWNARDAKSAMDPADATTLDNWFPQTGDVVVRKGYEIHCSTGETGAPVETLVEHNSGANRDLLACVNGKIIDVTTATPSTLATGFTESIWQTATFNGRTFFVNGTDAPQDYNGSAVAATTWTGPTAIADLYDVIAYKTRLYFVEKDTQSFWYGGQNAVNGALTEYDLTGVGNFGGNLIGMGIVTQDGGNGVDDLICFFFNSGEVAIYAGDDPAAANWALVGVFRIGAPIHPRAIVKFGSDVIAVTQDGYVALTDVLPFGRAQRRTLSDKIIGAASDAVDRFGSNEGWAVVPYAKSDMLIVNVPRSTTTFDQHVMNTRTGAWCRFRSMNGKCWSLFNDHLYFGGAAGVVYKADTGETDNSDPIIADGSTAWQYFGDFGSIKRFTTVRPIFVSQSTPPIALGLAIDFEPSVKTYAVNFSPSPNVGIWDESVWDQAIWAYSEPTSADWLSVSGVGYAASLRVRVASTDGQPRWQSVMYVYEPGDGF